MKFAVAGFESGNPALPDRVDPGAADPGVAMWDDLMALVMGAVFIPTIVVLGLFRLAALKRPKDLPPPQVDEWAASHELRTPK
jgi:hypothetical protein